MRLQKLPVVGQIEGAVLKLPAKQRSTIVDASIRKIAEPIFFTTFSSSLRKPLFETLPAESPSLIFLFSSVFHKLHAYEEVWRRDLLSCGKVRDEHLPSLLDSVRILGAMVEAFALLSEPEGLKYRSSVVRLAWLVGHFLDYSLLHAGLDLRSFMSMPKEYHQKLLKKVEALFDQVNLEIQDIGRAKLRFSCRKEDFVPTTREDEVFVELTCILATEWILHCSSLSAKKKRIELAGGFTRYYHLLGLVFYRLLSEVSFDEKEKCYPPMVWHATKDRNFSSSVSVKDKEILEHFARHLAKVVLDLGENSVDFSFQIALLTLVGQEWGCDSLVWEPFLNACTALRPSRTSNTSG